MITIEMVGEFYKSVESERNLYLNRSFWEDFGYRINHLWDVIRDDSDGFDTIGLDTVLSEKAEAVYHAVKQWVESEPKACQN